MPFDPCDRTRRRLPLLAGGELSGPDRRSAERHVITCDACRDRLASLNASLGLLRLTAAEPTTAAPAEPLWPALSRQLREQVRRPAPWSWDRVEPRASARAGLALAAAILVGAVGVGGWSWSRQYKVTISQRTPPGVAAEVLMAKRSTTTPAVDPPRPERADPEVARTSNPPTDPPRPTPRHAPTGDPRPAEQVGR